MREVAATGQLLASTSGALSWGIALPLHEGKPALFAQFDVSPQVVRPKVGGQRSPWPDASGGEAIGQLGVGVGTPSLDYVDMVLSRCNGRRYGRRCEVTPKRCIGLSSSSRTTALTLRRGEAGTTPALLWQARGVLAVRAQQLCGVTQPIHVPPPHHRAAASPTRPTVMLLRDHGHDAAADRRLGRAAWRAIWPALYRW